jgi:hypothetical protein
MSSPHILIQFVITAQKHMNLVRLVLNYIVVTAEAPPVECCPEIVQVYPA